MIESTILKAMLSYYVYVFILLIMQDVNFNYAMRVALPRSASWCSRLMRSTEIEVRRSNYKLLWHITCARMPCIGVPAEREYVDVNLVGRSGDVPLSEVWAQ